MGTGGSVPLFLLHMEYRGSCKAIFLHSQSFRILGAAFARLIVCRLRMSLGVDTTSFLKEECGRSLVNR
jgi:hypothetical protein